MDSKLIRGQGVAAGTDTYTLDLVPKLDAYRTDHHYYVEFTNSNSGASTLNINGLGAKSIKHEGGELRVGEILAGSVLLLKYDGTDLRVLWTSSTPLRICNTLIKTADESVINSTTLQDDDDIKLDIGANENWAFDVVLFVSETAGNPGLKLRMGAISGLTGSIEYTVSYANGTESVVSDFTTTTSIDITNVKGSVRIRGGVLSTAGGILVLQWAQDSLDAVNSTVIHKGSNLICEKAD